MTDLNRDTRRLDCGSTSRDLTIIEHAGEAAHTANLVPSAGHDDLRRLGTLVFEAAEMLSAPQGSCAIVCIERSERNPGGPWLGVLAAGPDLFGMAEPDGHQLLAEMAANLVAACLGVRAPSPVEDLALIVVRLATATGRLVRFVPPRRHRAGRNRSARDRRAPPCGAPRPRASGARRVMR